MSSWITPVQYAKPRGIRPQLVFQWIRKQGAPCKQIAGKWYVDPKLLEQWLKDKEARKQHRKERAEQRLTLSHEVRQAIRNFRSHRVKHHCPNCERETDYRVELVFSDDELFGRYTYANCCECGLDYHMGDITEEEALAVLLHGAPLKFPELVARGGTDGTPAK